MWKLKHIQVPSLPSTAQPSSCALLTTCEGRFQSLLSPQRHGGDTSPSLSIPSLKWTSVESPQETLQSVLAVVAHGNFLLCLSLSQIILHSMHRYKPRFHIVQADDLFSVRWSIFQVFSFPETVFTSVTAYQNEQVQCSSTAFGHVAKYSVFRNLAEEGFSFQASHPGHL